MCIIFGKKLKYTFQFISNITRMNLRNNKLCVVRTLLFMALGKIEKNKNNKPIYKTLSKI